MHIDKIIPSLSVVAIVGLHKDERGGPFLGTGSFVGDKNCLITCEHVLAGWKGAYAILPHEDTPKAYKAIPVKRDGIRDLAVLKVEEYISPYSFPLAKDEEINLNQIVCAFEYSPTETSGHHINFTPANRMGNVTRVRNLIDIYDVAGDHILELSFPALKGASGAPVLLGKAPFSLWGVVKAYYSRELMPAHVEKIHDESGKITEETKFYLPQALAIHVKHVRNMLNDLE